jgi:uncharacterized membrane protein (UPF0127 family)
MSSLKIRNRPSDQLLVWEGWVARSFWSKMKGLLRHSPLRPGQGLWIEGCNWIHTFGMGFPIDVLYLNREGRVVHVTSDMPPNRIGPFVWRARSVVELPVGIIERTGTEVGDDLDISWGQGGASESGHSGTMDRG